ncbi:hypothetical protein E4K67_18455 [Desulfosporosinus fructosivorans]|uniref:DUF975 family protein n=1 Tax=Desulfosporosinus fructosivorans TaxID=2018669 RepID=A0A4Z0R3K8_9FIRM|nr:hypothetical protein [Desulfosporosinus fructosivorans]TGE37059.1 hypothetical protein E4K67_18455 [Desulfosporosinus fructosivorans]
MSITDKFNEQFKAIHKVIWIILLPIILDIGELHLYERIFKTEYEPISQLFNLKIGFISAPPSIRYILEDFPSLIFQYNPSNFRGVINQINLANLLLLLSFVLVTSFLFGGYLSVISQAGHKKVTFKDFLQDGNRVWFKFFILNLLEVIPFLLMFIKKEYAYFSLVYIVLVYVQYSIVVDKVSLIENFQFGIRFLLQNLRLTIRMAISFGILFSLVGIVIHPLAKMGLNGIVLGSVITAYFGAVINKAVLEIYREVSQNQSEQIEEITPKE